MGIQDHHLLPIGRAHGRDLHDALPIYDNGYVGNLDLRPELANTLSATAGWHAASHQGWEFKITTYYRSDEHTAEIYTTLFRSMTTGMWETWTCGPRLPTP